MAADVKTLLRARAAALGFDAIGFTRAALDDSARARLNQFVAQGRHGGMGWMAARVAERGNPAVLWPEAVSVVSLGMSYAPAGDPLAALRDRLAGNISVYARGRDYHDVIKGRLKELAAVLAAQGAGVKVFVDTAPVMEKPLAQQAGLGWQGKHTNLVSRAHGSWLFLGEIFTILEIPPDAPTPDHCGTCRACLDACPTAAFPAPYQLDASRCISYLTIEHAGPIPLALREGMGNHIYGCDDCLAACPWNKFAQAGREAKLAAREDLNAPRLAELAGLDDAAFRRMFAGSPIKRAGRNRLVRNVAIAIGNSGEGSLLPVAQRLSMDADAVVAEAGAWAVARLQASTSSSMESNIDMTNGPEDMDVDPHREHAFRRGYVSGIYDALLGVKSKLTDEEFRKIESWIHQSLNPWTTSNLQKAVRPPPPSDSSLLSTQRKHRDGPFTLG